MYYLNMNMNSQTVLFFMIVLCAIDSSNGANIVGNPLIFAHPCNNTDIVYEAFEQNQPPDDENKYSLSITTLSIPCIPSLPAGSKIKLKFDSYVNLTLESKFARIYEEDGVFIISVHTTTTKNPAIIVRGRQGKPVPNLLSVIVHNEELCPDGVKTGLWDGYIRGPIDSATSLIAPPTTKKCGQKQLEFSELITNSQGTKPGDWPWHAAIFRTRSASSAEQTYICGGTLVSRRAVVTAGHCVVENGIQIIPERLYVNLGKYNIVGGDVAPQEKGVYEIVLHNGFSVKTLNDDIALLKLASEAIFGEYVQPICMWDKSMIDKSNVFGKLGTVVGWGITESGVLSTELAQAIMPIVTDYDCLQSYPIFFERFLNSKTFCAGFRNGTSVCNGDSGGGMYFSEESPQGRVIWSLRGLVSVSVSQRDSKTCDPTHYVVFTDVAKYLDWIENNK